MARHQSLLNLSTVAAIISLGLATVTGPSIAAQTNLHTRSQGQQLPASDQISQGFNPPNKGAPPSTMGGASRSDCVADTMPLIALMMPSTTPGLTTKASPTFFFYIPETVAQEAELVLKDANENDVDRITVKLPTQPGIVGVRPQLAQLEEGKDYQWYFSLVCNPGNRLNDVFLKGWIQRTEISDNLRNNLENAQPQEDVGLYINAGLWNDALTTLAELRRDNPNDTTIQATWKQLLNSAGLSPIAEAAVVLQQDLAQRNNIE